MFGCYDIKENKQAYTLAEMLIVLGILSLMMLAMPPLTKKLFKVKTQPKKHGRVECYYNSDNKLVKYETTEDGTPTLEVVENEDDGCQFNPPSNVMYIMIHAVGGGGAGYDVVPGKDNLQGVDLKFPNKRAYSKVDFSTANLWPEWFQVAMRSAVNRFDKITDSNQRKFEIKKTYTQQLLPYGLAGQPGERVTLFFPSLQSSTTIKMKPGKGGISVTDGGAPQKENDEYKEDGKASTVDFKYVNTEEFTRVITAKGGQGGGNALGDNGEHPKGNNDSSYKNYRVKLFGAELAGGEATDFGVGNLQSVKMQPSSFDDVLENTSSKLKSNINNTSAYDIKGKTAKWGGNKSSVSGSDKQDMKAGWGGNGGYYYLSEANLNGNFTYMLDNYGEYEVPDGSGNVYQYKWYVLTKDIPTSFYRRNGLKSKCNLVSTPEGEFELDAKCPKDTSYTYNSVRYYYCNVPASFEEDTDREGEMYQGPRGYLRTVKKGPKPDVAVTQNLWDNWQVQEKFDANFYKLLFKSFRCKENESDCSISTNSVELDNYASITSNDNYCFAKNGACNQYVDGTKITKSLFNDESGSYTPLYNKFKDNKCTFNKDEERAYCYWKKPVLNSKHECRYNGEQIFTCPYGNQDRSNGVCHANNGGNGAIIIIW